MVKFLFWSLGEYDVPLHCITLRSTLSSSGSTYQGPYGSTYMGEIKLLNFSLRIIKIK